MSEQLTIHHERIDDLPLLFTQLQRLQLAKLVDECFPTHGNWRGLSLGEVLSVWLVFILSEANHRMSHVQPWAQARLRTLAACLGTEEEEEEVRALDFSDDRLAAVLDYLSEDDAWREFERRLNEHTLRVYDLRPKRVRVDATTAKYHGALASDDLEEGLFRFGHSKDRRPDLPQLKINLAVLDPLGMPFSSTVVSGNRADELLYVAEIRRVQEQAHLGGRQEEEEGLTFIGDVKMAALSTRAFVAASNDYYLCPLSATQVPPEEMDRLLAPVFREQSQRLDAVFRPREEDKGTPAEEEEEEELIAEGYEFSVRMEATTLEGSHARWSERRLVVRSVAYAEALHRALAKRLKKARTEIAALNERRQGKKVFTEETEMRAAGERIVSRHRVEGLLRLECQTGVEERKVRRYGARSAPEVREQRTLTITARVEEAALARARQRLGWRVYATNQPKEELSLEQAVLAYREEYLIERGFGRLKGKPLSLAPLYLQRDERAKGLVRVLLIALRVLCLVEFSVRRRLATERGSSGGKLLGIYPGNPKRATSRPTSEMMLRAFEGLMLILIEEGGEVRAHLTPLSAVQQRILELLGWSEEIYSRLAQHFSKPLLKMSEP